MMFRRNVVALVVIFSALVGATAQAGVVKFNFTGKGKGNQTLFEKYGFEMQASAFYGTDPSTGLLEANVHNNHNGLGVRTPGDSTNMLDFKPLKEGLTLELLQFAMPTGSHWHSIALHSFSVGELVLGCGTGDAFAVGSDLSSCNTISIFGGQDGNPDIFSLTEFGTEDYLGLTAVGKFASSARVAWVKVNTNGVPEPGVIFMLVLGLAGLITHRRFKAQ